MCRSLSILWVHLSTVMELYVCEFIYHANPFRTAHCVPNAFALFITIVVVDVGDGGGGGDTASMRQQKLHKKSDFVVSSVQQIVLCYVARNIHLYTPDFARLFFRLSIPRSSTFLAGFGSVATVRRRHFSIESRIGVVGGGGEGGGGGEEGDPVVLGSSEAQ